MPAIVADFVGRHAHGGGGCSSATTPPHAKMRRFIRGPWPAPCAAGVRPRSPWRHRGLQAPDAEESHTHMDIEQINAIGTLLADLSQRTEQLRGYL